MSGGLLLTLLAKKGLHWATLPHAGPEDRQIPGVFDLAFVCSCLAHSLRLKASHVTARTPSCCATPSLTAHWRHRHPNLPSRKDRKGPCCNVMTQPQAGLSLDSRAAEFYSFNSSNKMHNRYSDTGKEGCQSPHLTFKSAHAGCPSVGSPRR